MQFLYYSLKNKTTGKLIEIFSYTDEGYFNNMTRYSIGESGDTPWLVSEKILDNFLAFKEERTGDSYACPKVCTDTVKNLDLYEKVEVNLCFD